MTVQEFMNRLVQYLTELCDGQWERWQLLAAGAGIVLLLMLAISLRRKIKGRITELEEHSPIIGVGLTKRARFGIRRFRWRVSLVGVLTALVLLSFLTALSVWVLNHKAAHLEEPARRAAVSVVKQAASLIGVEQRADAETESFDRQERIIDKKIRPFYVKYKNKYALLPVSGEYIELPGFDPKDEDRFYRHSCADTGHSLPDWKIGDYGAIPPRRILQILGPEQMLVAGFISEDGRITHFKGWPTEKLIEGMAWPYEPSITNPNQHEETVEVAVVGMYRYRTLIGEAANIPSIVPLELFRKGVTVDEFKDLLLSNVGLPEDLERLRSDIIAIPAAYSDESLPARTQPKLPGSASVRRGAGNGFKQLPASS